MTLSIILMASFVALLSSKPSVTTMEDSSMSYAVTLGQHMAPTFCTAASFRCLLFTHVLATLFLSWTIITPYKEPVLGPVQAWFNKYLSKARGIIEIEMSFGRIGFNGELFPTDPTTQSAGCA